MITTKSKQGGKPRHIPQRTCIACRQVKAKRELVRVVHTQDGTVEIDPQGKMSGRGAYLCKRGECWEAGLKGNRLEYALRAKIAPQNRARLAEYAELLPKDQPAEDIA